MLFDKINLYFEGKLAGKTIAIWGLAFKPETDDIREAPAITVIHQLLAAGARVNAYDPEAMPNFKAQVTDKINYCDDMYDALKGADALAGSYRMEFV